MCFVPYHLRAVSLTLFTPFYYSTAFCPTSPLINDAKFSSKPRWTSQAASTAFNLRFVLIRLCTFFINSFLFKVVASSTYKYGVLSARRWIILRRCRPFLARWTEQRWRKINAVLLQTNGMKSVRRERFGTPVGLSSNTATQVLQLQILYPRSQIFSNQFRMPDTRHFPKSTAFSNRRFFLSPGSYSTNRTLFQYRTFIAFPPSGTSASFSFINSSRHSFGK